MTAPARAAALARATATGGRRVRRDARRSVIGAAIASVVLSIAAATLQPATGGPGVRAMGPLPPCRYDDLLTSPRGYADWPVTLVDTILRVTKGYVPPDLVPVARADIAGTGQVRLVMIDDLRAMAEAARAAGSGIGVQSAYRSYQQQQAVFDGWVATFGYERALQLSARPGHSEHQLGLAIDFRSDPGGSPFTGSWGATEAGKWMRQHAWEYGFVMSYPKGAIDVVCYDYEPWHFRYVGREIAQAVHDSGLTLRAYLWANFTATIVPPPTKPPGAPAPTAVPVATPTLGPSPSPTPSPTAAPSPSPIPTPVVVATLAATPAPTADAGPAAGPSPALAAGFVGLAILIGTIVLGSLLVRGRVRSG